MPAGLRGVRIAVAAAAASLLGLKAATALLVRRAERRYPPLGEFLTVDGSRLHYVAQGAGQPVVLFHGDGGSVYDWTLSTFDQIARAYRAVAFDRPGFGYSERPPGGASALVQAALLHSAVQALGLVRPVLLAHSRGVSVALAYALQYPDDIAGVVDLGGAVLSAEGWAPRPIRALRVPLFGPLLAHTVYVPLLGRRLVRAGLETAFAPEGPAPADYLDAYAAMLLRPGPLRAMAGDYLDGPPALAPLIPRYADLRMPVVIVNGTADRSNPVEQARMLHRIIPTAELIEVPDAGHEVMFFHPEVVLQALRSVIARASP